MLSKGPKSTHTASDRDIVRAKCVLYSFHLAYCAVCHPNVGQSGDRARKDARGIYCSNIRRVLVEARNCQYLPLALDVLFLFSFVSEPLGRDTSVRGPCVLQRLVEFFRACYLLEAMESASPPMVSRRREAVYPFEVMFFNWIQANAAFLLLVLIDQGWCGTYISLAFESASPKPWPCFWSFSSLQ